MTKKKESKKSAKKGAATAAPAEKPGLLDDVTLAITAKFSVVEIKMKNDWRWKVKLLVHSILPRAYHDYNIKLEFDEAPYQKTIDQLEKEAADLGRNPTLLPDVDKRSMRDLDKRIADARKEMNQMRELCPTIEFTPQTEEIKYSDGDTVLLFKVLDSVIQPLNEQKYRLNEYRAILDPIIR